MRPWLAGGHTCRANVIQRRSSQAATDASHLQQYHLRPSRTFALVRRGDHQTPEPSEADKAIQPDRGFPHAGLVAGAANCWGILGPSLLVSPGSSFGEPSLHCHPRLAWPGPLWFGRTAGSTAGTGGVRGADWPQARSPANGPLALPRARSACFLRPVSSGPSLVL